MMYTIKLLDDIKKYELPISFDYNHDYAGYVDFEAAKVKFKDAIAFSISKVRQEGDSIVGDFQMINGKASELLAFIGQFDINTVLRIEEDVDINKPVSVTIDSFVAIPNLE